MIVNIVFIIIIFAVIVMLINAFKEQDIVRKIISLNAITSYIIVLICLFVISDKNKVYFIDVAIVYGLLSFIASVAFLKYSEGR